ncbi:MAG: hypothetical protein KC443_14475 [Anaerolineales bacterium]|nr:hypothetical protein [Anaerolineales bacterium]
MDAAQKGKAAVSAQIYRQSGVGEGETAVSHTLYLWWHNTRHELPHPGARFSPAQKRGELSFTPQEILTIVSRATIANEKGFAACTVDTSDLGGETAVTHKSIGFCIPS